jgi:glycolate dehydrogenase FAD-binding subunit
MSRVDNPGQALEFVRAARDAKAPFEIVAGGTRRSVGRPAPKTNGSDLPLLDVSGLCGIIKYEPEELILTAQPATKLAEINAVLAAKNQRLGFDPADWSQLLRSNGATTLAGAVSCDASGSGRLRHGGARDSLLGFQAVNGLGDSFRAGGKVVKNVTGFDLPKLVCGAYGTLCLLTEMTFRVYPKAQHAAILCLSDVTPEIGFAHLRNIAHSALEPAGLAYLPASMIAPAKFDGGRGVALIKLEGASKPLEEKIAMARGLLGAVVQRLEDDMFAAIGSGEKFSDLPGDVWRVMVAPSDAPRVVKELNVQHWLGDWAGGLIWLAAAPSDAARIRNIAAAAQGQAMLLRASPESRTSLGLFAPQPPALAALNRAVKAAFDPLSLFNPGRL